MALFCPSAADWGNVADWVSGIGSITVGAVALYFARAENHRANLADQRAENAEKATLRVKADQHNSLIVQGLKIVSSLRVQLASFIATDDDFSSVQILDEEMVRARDSAKRIQNLPFVTPDLFGAMERLANLPNYEEGVRLLPVFKRELQHLEAGLASLHIDLIEMADPNAILKW